MEMHLEGVPMGEIDRIKEYWEKKGYHVNLSVKTYTLTIFRQHR